MLPSLNWFLFSTWYIITPLLLGVSSGQELENVAYRKPVYTLAKWPGHLVDGNLDSVIQPVKSMFPAIVVDLLDVYHIRSIHLFASKKKEGLFIPFSVYASSSKFTNPCDFELHYPWRTLRREIYFKKSGQEISFTANEEARYIIILPKFKYPYELAATLPLAELKVMGKKARDGSRPIAPDDGPPVLGVMETRKELLRDQGWIKTNNKYMSFQLNFNHSDVAVTWVQGRVTMLASLRKQTRILSLFDTKPLSLLLDTAGYKPLRENARRWLSKQSSTARFVYVTEPYGVGDIIVIRPYDNFNVDQVYEQLMQGNNSALIAYTNEAKKTGPSLPELMKKLEIIVVESSWANWEMSTHVDTFLRDRREPFDESDLQIAHKSWRIFRTEVLQFGHMKEEEIEKPEFQTLVRAVLKKYYDFIYHYGPCRIKPYDRMNETAVALRNYNEVLLLQRGDNIVVAPGAWGSPGGVYKKVKPSSYTVRYEIDIEGTYFPTAGYAKPGEPIYYEVLNHSAPTVSWFWLQINPQIDSIHHKPYWHRWPKVWLRQNMKQKGQMVSPFGGPITIRVPANQSLTVRLSNVYRYPFFNIRDPKSVDNWEREKKTRAPTPYGMIMGDNMISMLEYPVLLRMDAYTIHWSTQFFDNIVKIIHNYRGSNYNMSRLEVFVTDDDISGGDGHAGYPWMAYRHWAGGFDAIERNKQGKNIGYPHEIGHNLQLYKMTLVNGVEVTNNMFIPVINKYLFNLDSYSKGAKPGWTQEDENDLIRNWKTDKYVGVQVSYYNYLGRMFSPALVGNVLPIVLETKVPLNTEEQKVNFWIKNLCNESRHDLVPFHRLWHLPINEETVTFCSQFPCVFPDDELTQKVPDLVEKILKDSGKQNCSRSKPPDVAFKNDVLKGVNTVKPQSIFISEN